MTPKFKKGNLYLYHCNDLLIDRYIDVPVLSLRIKKTAPSTWLCLFPDGTRCGLYPEDLKDITLKKK